MSVPMQFLPLENAVTLAWVPSPMELVIVLVVVLLLFGNRLPGAMKSLGQSFVAFKKGIKEGEDDPLRSESESARLK